ncbi:hypothetical protein SDC9_115194 [bioreactor metagenome]|uniref:Uncharacterized protein n=1 Tax=bioreactor metagenome TaxID=1076179 RepID=A0A645BYS0_9ZZZZ
MKTQQDHAAGLLSPDAVLGDQHVSFIVAHVLGQQTPPGPCLAVIVRMKLAEGFHGPRGQPQHILRPVAHRAQEAGSFRHIQPHEQIAFALPDFARPHPARQVEGDVFAGDQAIPLRVHQTYLLMQGGEQTGHFFQKPFVHARSLSLVSILHIIP